MPRVSERVMIYGIKSLVFTANSAVFFMDNNKPTKEHHFSGYRHRMNKEAKIREIQKKQKEKDEINDMKNKTLKMIEIKAKEAYRKDCGLNPTTEGDIIATLSEWKEVQTEKGETYFWNEKTDV